MSDPDQLDYFFTDDDIVTAVFDRATDLGANEARRGRVDALLAFNIPPGADYSGQWIDDSTFAVTVSRMRHSCDTHATLMRQSCDSHATVMSPSCHRHVTAMSR